MEPQLFVPIYNGLDSYASPTHVRYMPVGFQQFFRQPGHGHYTATMLDAQQNKWYEANDELMRQADPPASCIVTAAIYQRASEVLPDAMGDRAVANRFQRQASGSSCTKRTTSATLEKRHGCWKCASA
jgi:hypothetical protein